MKKLNLTITPQDNARVLGIFHYILESYGSKTATIERFKEFSLKKFQHCRKKSPQDVIKSLPKEDRLRTFSLNDFKGLNVVWYMNTPIITIPAQVMSKNLNLFGYMGLDGIILTEGRDLKSTLIYELIHCFLEYLFLVEENYETPSSPSSIVSLKDLYYTVRHKTIAYSLTYENPFHSYTFEELFYTLTHKTIEEITNLFGIKISEQVRAYIVRALPTITNYDFRDDRNLVKKCTRNRYMHQWM